MRTRVPLKAVVEGATEAEAVSEEATEAAKGAALEAGREEATEGAKAVADGEVAEVTEKTLVKIKLSSHFASTISNVLNTIAERCIQPRIINRQQLISNRRQNNKFLLETRFFPRIH